MNHQFLYFLFFSLSLQAMHHHALKDEIDTQASTPCAPDNPEIEVDLKEVTEDPSLYSKVKAQKSCICGFRTKDHNELIAHSYLCEQRRHILANYSPIDCQQNREHKNFSAPLTIAHLERGTETFNEKQIKTIMNPEMHEQERENFSPLLQASHLCNDRDYFVAEDVEIFSSAQPEELLDSFKSTLESPATKQSTVLNTKNTFVTESFAAESQEDKLERNTPEQPVNVQQENQHLRQEHNFDNTPRHKQCACGKQFTLPEKLVTHIKKNHFESPFFICPYPGCTTRRDALQLMLDHFSLRHTNEEIGYSCTCGFISRNYSTMRGHKLRMNSQLQTSIRCFCGFIAEDNNSMNDHLKEKHLIIKKRDYYYCGIKGCLAKGVRSLKGLIKHFATKHPQLLKKYKLNHSDQRAIAPFKWRNSADTKCICGVVTGDEIGLEKHLIQKHSKMHDARRIFQCSAPGCSYKPVPRLRDLARHLCSRHLRDSLEYISYQKTDQINDTNAHTADDDQLEADAQLVLDQPEQNKNDLDDQLNDKRESPNLETATQKHPRTNNQDEQSIQEFGRKRKRSLTANQDSIKKARAFRNVNANQQHNTNDGQAIAKLDNHKRMENPSREQNVDSNEETVTKHVIISSRHVYKQCACGEQCNSPEDLVTHVKDKHFNTVYICPICQLKQSGKLDFIDHMAAKHTGEEAGYTCSCGHTVLTHQGLRSHIRAFLNVNDDQQNKTSNEQTISELDNDKLRENSAPEQSIACNETTVTKHVINSSRYVYKQCACGEQCNSPEDLHAHVRDKHFNTVYICPVCQLKQRVRLYFIDHMAIKHTNEEAGYTCSCGFRSPTNQGILLHIRKMASPSKRDTKSASKHDSDTLTFLIKTIAEGKLAAVNDLLDTGDYLDLKDATYDATPLMHAVSLGQLDIVRLLIRRGAHLKQRNKLNQNALMLAAHHGHEKIVELLIPHIDVHEVDSNGLTAKDLALKQGHTNSAELLDTFFRPLIFAAQRRDLEKAQQLILDGVNIEERDAVHQATALLHASMIGDASMIRLLMRHGANVSARNRFNQNALMLAAQVGHKEIVELLLLYIDLNEKDCHGLTAKDFASKYARSLTGKLLSDTTKMQMIMQQQLNRHDNTGFTPLIYAIRQGNLEMITRLLNAGAELELRDTVCNATPLLHAASAGKFEVVKLLLSRGASIAAYDRGNNDALMIAAQRGHRNIAQLLLTWNTESDACISAGNSIDSKNMQTASINPRESSSLEQEDGQPGQEEATSVVNDTAFEIRTNTDNVLFRNPEDAVMLDQSNGAILQADATPSSHAREILAIATNANFQQQLSIENKSTLGNSFGKIATAVGEPSQETVHTSAELSRILTSLVELIIKNDKTCYCDCKLNNSVLTRLHLMGHLNADVHQIDKEMREQAQMMTSTKKPCYCGFISDNTHFVKLHLMQHLLEDF